MVSLFKILDTSKQTIVSLKSFFEFKKDFQLFKSAFKTL